MGIWVEKLGKEEEGHIFEVRVASPYLTHDLNDYWVRLVMESRLAKVAFKVQWDGEGRMSKCGNGSLYCSTYIKLSMTRVSRLSTLSLGFKLSRNECEYSYMASNRTDTNTNTQSHTHKTCTNVLSYDTLTYTYTHTHTHSYIFIF